MFRRILAKKEDFSQFQQHPNIRNLENFFRLSKESSNSLRKKKRAAFCKYCSSLHANSDLDSVWSTVRAFSTAIKPETKLTKIVSTLTASNLRFEKIAPFTQESFPDHSDLLNNITPLNLDLDNSYMAAPLSIEEYMSVIKFLKICSAPGQIRTLLLILSLLNFL